MNLVAQSASKMSSIMIPCLVTTKKLTQTSNCLLGPNCYCRTWFLGGWENDMTPPLLGYAAYHGGWAVYI